MSRLSNAALLVIDILEGGMGDPEAPEVISYISCAERVVDAARKAGIPIIFLNDAHIENLDRELELWGPHGIAGTPEAQTLHSLGPVQGDYVIPKRRYSGFFETDLDLTLRELGVDTVVCIGCDTNICVRHTVADAYFRNYRSMVVTDATYTCLVGNQADGLEYMERCYASGLLAASELLDELAP